MLVATEDIDKQKLLEYIDDYDKLSNYVMSLIPLWARHIPGIISNQKYLVAVTIRNMISVPYKQRTSISNRLLDGVRLNGVLNTVVTLNDLLTSCNIDTLIHLLKED